MTNNSVEIMIMLYLQMKKIFILLLILLHVELYAQNSESKKLSFFDKNDSMLDMSNYLSQVYGFLPVPMLITEPAIGFGAGLSLVYLHDKFTGKKAKSGRNIPASMSGIVGGGTENGTYFGGAFHIGYYKEDTIRTETFIGYPSVNINFYTQNQRAILMNIKGIFAYQSLRYRLLDSNFFVGLAYTYSKIESQVKQNDSSIELPSYEIQNSAISALLDYDSRDNVLSPNKGMLFNAKAMIFDEALGSDINVQRYSAQELFYIPLSTKLNFDHRLQYAQIVGKNTPFYMYPAISMRGVPAMRYQGEKTLLYETQLRYEFIQRWSALIFGGVAKAYGKDKFRPQSINTPFNEAPSIWTKGVGFRYLIARKFGLRVGIDLASSQEDQAFYIQFGTAWIGF